MLSNQRLHRWDWCSERGLSDIWWSVMHDLTTKSIKMSGTMLSYNKKIENDEKLMNKKSYHSRENYYVYSFSVIKDYTPC